MSDISKCNGFDCPLRNKCYRFTAIANEHWQSYMNPPGKWIGRKFECEYYIDNKPYLPNESRTRR